MGAKIVTIVFLFFLCVSPLFAAEGIDRIIDEAPSKVDTMPKIGLTIALSIIPGGGQMYQKDYIHGGLFLGFETLFGTIAVNRWQKYHGNLDGADTIRMNYYTLLATPDFDTSKALDTLFALERKEYEASRMKMLHRNYSAWFTGVYVWNMFDAVGYSGIVRGVETPNPRRAAALSAIPFLGLGQLYNGKSYKAGLVWAMQIGCLTSAINFQRLMNESKDRQTSMLNSPLFDGSTVDLGDVGRVKDHWQGTYDSATRSRTMFMWYGVIFYLYGILDAYVDAHLHNFESKFDIVGGFNPLEEEVGLMVTYDFGKSRSSKRVKKGRHERDTFQLGTPANGGVFGSTSSYLSGNLGR